MRPVHRSQASDSGTGGGGGGGRIARHGHPFVPAGVVSPPPNMEPFWPTPAARAGLAHF